MTASVGVGATAVPLPLVAISPGSVVDVGELVSVEDPDPDPDPVDRAGGFYLTTVKLSPVTLVQAVRGWARDDVDLVSRREVSPGSVDADELRRLNLEQMDTSKLQALGAAFEALGYDAVSGDGAEVVDVAAGGPVGGALEAGDLVVGLDGTAVSSHHDVLRLLGERRPGDRVELVVRPAGEGTASTEVVTLATGPDGAGRAQLGATLATCRPRLDLPVDVAIATERIGGSSAGLAFTLQVLDSLSEGDLTGGRRVAATGTIDLDGSVGEVGGVAQKAAALERHAIDLFLVPTAELDRAAALVAAGVRVEPVGTLGDALDVLAEGRGATRPRRW